MTVAHVFDPGVTTGYCIASFDDSLKEELPTCYSFQLLTGITAIVKWEALLVEYAHPVADFVIVEDFHLFGQFAQHKIGSSFEEIQIIGAIRFVTTKLGIKLVLQQPSVKQSIRKALEKDFPQSLNVPTEHLKDVVCHAVYYYWSVMGRWH